MRIVGVIQARLGSTRLPQKVLKSMIGKPMIRHFVERCQRSAVLADLIIACPLKDVGEISRAVDCKVYANGTIPEDDLLSRFWGVAVMQQPDFIVRLCSDNPCIDPRNIDILVDRFVREGMWERMGSNLGDWAHTKWPQGLGAEIYPIPFVHWLYHSMTEPEYREHPHTFGHEQQLLWEPECPFPWTPPFRLEINTQADFDHVSKVFDHFGNNTFSSEEVIAYFQGAQDGSK